MTKPARSLVMLAAFASAAAAPAGSDGDAASYRLRLPLTLADTAPVQRIELPAQVLVALQSSDMADVRIFDANGRATAMSRMPAPLAPSRSVTLPALPIRGSSTALDITGVSLKTDEQGRARIASVDGKIAKVDGTAIVVGALFDTRGITGNGEQLALDAIVPAGQPVTFIVDASEDLKTWRRMGERVVYAAPRDALGSDNKTVVLDGTLLRNTRLRVTWRSESRLLAPVDIRNAVLTVKSGDTGIIKTVTATASPSPDTYTLEFVVPFRPPVATIAVETMATEGVVPVRILGRNHSEAPWIVLGNGSAQSAAAAIALSGPPVRVIRIEADRRTAGFLAKPAIRFGLMSHDIAFVASGNPPFTVAAGRADTRDIFLPLESITRTSPDALSTARLPDAAGERIALQPPSDNAAFRRQLMLWTILLGVTALLGAITWRLWSRRPADFAPPDNANPPPGS